MAETFISRAKNAWNAFWNLEPTKYVDNGIGTTYRPDRVRIKQRNERSIVNSVYTRIALDAASADIRHVRTDKEGKYLEDLNSDLDYCLNIEANIDQTGRAFRQDIFSSMLDEGCVAVVPVDTTYNPAKSDSYKIKTMRTGKIIMWYPDKVLVNLYNDRTGRHEDILLPKKMCTIVENPFFSIMNEPNSIMQRLIRKLNILDAIDEQSGSGKLDLIIQLPYVIKTQARKTQAEERRKDIEQQLAGSKYGIAYTDGTERITQLNRPAENNLMKQIEYLTSMLYSQLGITQSIMDGTADEAIMANYFNRTIDVLISALIDEMKRKFISKTARSEGQSIMYFRNPFKLTPPDKMADIADKYTRNEIVSSNEVRQYIGLKPSTDPKADELRNKNIGVTGDSSGDTNTPNETEQINMEEETQNEQE